MLFSFRGWLSECEFRRLVCWREPHHFIRSITNSNSPLGLESDSYSDDLVAYPSSLQQHQSPNDSKLGGGGSASSWRSFRRFRRSRPRQSTPSRRNAPSSASSETHVATVGVAETSASPIFPKISTTVSSSSLPHSPPSSKSGNTTNNNSSNNKSNNQRIVTTLLSSNGGGASLKSGFYPLTYSSRRRRSTLSHGLTGEFCVAREFQDHLTTVEIAYDGMVIQADRVQRSIGDLVVHVEGADSRKGTVTVPYDSLATLQSTIDKLVQVIKHSRVLRRAPAFV